MDENEQDRPYDPYLVALWFCEAKCLRLEAEFARARKENDALALEVAELARARKENDALALEVAVSRKWAARWKRAAWLFCDLWREERMFLRAADEENDDLIAELARWRRYTLDCVFEDYAASWKRLADSDSDSAAALRAWAERLEDK